MTRAAGRETHPVRRRSHSDPEDDERNHHPSLRLRHIIGAR